MQEQTPTPLLDKQYHIPLDLFRRAFTAFQKKYVYPKTYFMMAMLLVAAGIYSYFMTTVTASQRPIYCMIVLLCLVMCGIQWFNPRKIRRNLMEAVKEIEEDRYFLKIYQEYLEIGTILPEEAPSEEAQEDDALFDDTPKENFTGTRMHYNSEMKVTEYDDFFLLYQKRSMVYVIPKSAFNEEEAEILRVHFQKVLDKNFQSKQ